MQHSTSAPFIASLASFLHQRMHRAQEGCRPVQYLAFENLSPLSYGDCLEVKITRTVFGVLCMKVVHNDTCHIHVISFGRKTATN